MPDAPLEARVKFALQQHRPRGSYKVAAGSRATQAAAALASPA
jgi:hypothetical protein